VLAPAGEALILASSLTGLGAVDDIAGEAGLDTREIAEESFPFERLVVLSVRPA
jgi:release factor glutamine methyltransferase